MMYYPGYHSTSTSTRRDAGLNGPNAQQRGAVKPLPLLSFSNGKGSPAF
uniref:Uncharacterized protein n=1 Tax=Fundulus heteroclitus TaxID=8078 RepID=A0A3Q2T7L8_FUNHE